MKRKTPSKRERPAGAEPPPTNRRVLHLPIRPKNGKPPQRFYTRDEQSLPPRVRTLRRKLRRRRSDP